MYFDIFRNVKKLNENFARTYSHARCAQCHFTKNCRLACLKKINFDIKNKAFMRHVLPFLHQPQNVPIFCETL
jgi:hypothetical protein